MSPEYLDEVIFFKILFNYLISYLYKFVEISDAQTSLSLLPCEFCTDFFSSTDLIDHQVNYLLNFNMFNQIILKIN